MKSVFKDYTRRFGLSLLLGILLALPTMAQNHRASKDISEKYDVGSSDEVEISNRYGNVTINTWNKREVAVNVKIEAWGKNEEQAQTILDRINVRHAKNGNTISFHTEIESKSWKDMNNDDKKGFEINFTINMPDDLTLDLSNKYGRINMPDYKGKLELSVAYGRVTTGELLGDDNEISVKYSGGSSFKSIAKGDITLRYSSGVEIDKAGSLEVSDRYGGLKIGEIEELDIDMGYTSLKIGKLHKKIVADSKYSSGKIEDIRAGFDEVRIETSYGSFGLYFDASASFDFEVDVRYAGFKNRISGVEMKREYVKHSSSQYSGMRKGKSGKKGFVKVYGSYGGFSFN